MAIFFAALFIGIAWGLAKSIIKQTHPEWLPTAEEEKPKRKNDEDPEPTSHFELGDDGELMEVDDRPEKPKRRED